MPRPVKIISRIVVVLGLLLFSLWIYLQYKIKASYKTSVPPYANGVLRINVYELGKILFIDKCRHPSEWFSVSGNKDTTTTPELGIDVPFNIFGYTVPQLKGTIIFSFVINNKNDFLAYLKKQQGISIDATSSIIKASLPSSHCNMVFNDRELLVAFSWQPQPTIDVELLGELNNTNRITLKESEWKGVLQQDVPVQWLAKNGNGQLVFQDKHLKCTATITNSLYTFRQSVLKPGLDVNAAIALSAFFDTKSNPVPTAYAVGTQRINLDTTFHYLDGASVLVIDQSVQQTDSIVGYDYDDNFQKTQTVKVQTNNVPHICWQLYGDAPRLLDSWEKNDLVSTNYPYHITDRLFPLYKLWLSNTNDIMQLSTDPKEPVLKPIMEQSPYCFEALVDFQKIKAQQLWPILVPYIQSLSQLNIRAKSGQDMHSLTVDAHLSWADKSRHPLVQIMKAIENIK